MSGGVNDVNVVLLVAVGPVQSCCRRGDGDTTLLLLLHPVHGSRTVVYFTNLVVHTSVVEDALGGGRLAGIYVGSDTNVARKF